MRLDFTAGKKADSQFPNGVIFQDGYTDKKEAERKMMELRGLWQRDLIAEDGMMRQMHQTHQFREFE